MLPCARDSVAELPLTLTLFICNVGMDICWMDKRIVLIFLLSVLKDTDGTRACQQSTLLKSGTVGDAAH